MWLEYNQLQHFDILVFFFNSKGKYIFMISQQGQFDTDPTSKNPSEAIS
jgi:hypothetical protein